MYTILGGVYFLLPLPLYAGIIIDIFLEAMGDIVSIRFDIAQTNNWLHVYAIVKYIKSLFVGARLYPITNNKMTKKPRTINFIL